MYYVWMNPKDLRLDGDSQSLMFAHFVTCFDLFILH